ncbi:mitofilin family membrane protein [Jannaschia sp.]|nr:mitofilin family membrane protein [Jannaschia sp.]
MARKTKRPRTTRAASGAPETDPRTITETDTAAAAETIAEAEAIEETRIEEAVVVRETDETPIAPAADGQATPVDGDLIQTEDAPIDDAALTSQGSALGGDSVPPEDTADIGDLARLDGADPAGMEAAAADGADTLPAEDTPVEVVEERATPLVPAAQPQAETKSGSGFVPLVLGGLLAGAIGYAIPTFLAPEEQTDDLAALEARIDALPAAGSDLTAIEATQSDLTARLDALSARIDVLEARPDTAAAQAASASTATPSGDAEALAALRTDVDRFAGVATNVDALAVQIQELEIDALSERIVEVATSVDALSATVDALPAPPPDVSDRVAALESDLDALNQETEAVEVSAEERAREAAANQLRIAVDSGVPYAEPLTVIGGDVPAVLADNAESGLPTDQALADAFPGAARTALTQARGVQSEEGGLTAFIRRQTGARSLEPRDGDDADAVLSRAEAAMRAGDVDTALTEVETLPPEAQDAMAGWIADARTRAEARVALQDYLGTE